MRVLVTGGAGFIGSHLVEAMVANNYDVAVLDNLEAGSSDHLIDDVRFFNRDIRDRSAVFDVLREFQPNVVSHQAAQSSIVNSIRNCPADAQTNIVGTLNLLDASIATNVSRFIFASTGGAIYGEISEGSKAGIDLVPQPISPYAIGKLAAETYVKYFHNRFGLPVHILRYANVYGSRQSPHGEAGVVAIFLWRLQQREPLTIYARNLQGDEGCIRDYIHVSDVVRANIAAIEGHIQDLALNVGTGIGTSTCELAQKIMQLSGFKSELKFAGKREGDVKYSVLDAVRFQELMGPALPLAVGLKKTIQPN